MGRKRRTDHLKVVDERKRRVLRCRACGDEFTLLLPCSITMWTTACRQFERENASCREAWDKARVQLLQLLLTRASERGRRVSWWI